MILPLTTEIGSKTQAVSKTLKHDRFRKNVYYDTFSVKFKKQTGEKYLEKLHS